MTNTTHRAEVCRFCRGVFWRYQMVAIKRLPGFNARAKGWACLERCAWLRGYKVNTTSLDSRSSYKGATIETKATPAKEHYDENEF